MIPVEALDPEEEAERPRRLPEPPTGWTLVALIVALCFLAGAVGWTLGRGRPPGADTVDVGFLRDMRTHHEGAILLAQLELDRGENDRIRVFADEVILYQSYDIGLMDRMQLDWGYRPEERPDTAMGWMGEEIPLFDMPGMATNDELALLREEADDPDAVFVALLVDHHAAGIAMAEHAAAEARDADVKALARRIAEVQQAEIGEMLATAEREGIDIDQPGVDFDVFDPATGSAASGHGGH